MFKESFKRYKSKSVAPDLSDVIDFRCHFSEKAKFQVIEAKVYGDDIHFCGLKPVSEWKISEIKGHPGLIHIDNPFTITGQRYWICRSIASYTKKPNCRLNLDPFNILKKEEDWWEESNRDSERADKLKKELRWSTLGYHHNWDTKVYSENSRDPFPDDLTALCKYVAEALGFENFVPQAAIVNFYHQGCTLAGHTDRSENNVTAPLLSFSFGCSAIFLLGGHSLEVKPSAMLLHSGDILVMSGESRLCYHGVPKILPGSELSSNDLSETSICNDCSSVLDGDIYKLCSNSTFWIPFQKYINNSRINLNVRQVLFPNQLTLYN